MAENLVIVESPAKAGTIQKFLGDDYIVKPSFGHIRDLQDKKISVDIEHNFTPEYVIPSDKKKVVSELKKLASTAKTIWLASDEDREGEAISWHLFEALGLNKENTRRIVFHEITKPAILKAIENPRTIDMNLVDAQQARRVLDRLVGFELSPVLWRKIQPKLSAGRVQSVALRLVVDREREIIGFERTPYYNVTATFHPEGTAKNVKVNATLDNKFEDIAQARKFLEDSIGAQYAISNMEKKEGARHPAAPFTTSTLQQEASRKLRFSVSQTMRIAQQLYERGLITYMRTDSTNLSELALGTTKDFIIQNFGEEYAHRRQYKTKAKGAQEAHEAIRPTFVSNTEIEGSPQEKKLYNLIWKRTVASQMEDAKVMRTDITLASHIDNNVLESVKERSERFHIHATQVLFDGFLKLYIESTDDPQDDEEIILPDLKIGDQMNALSLLAECKFTTPPARYSEAALVKKLEELGIGRPSTYAPTITTLTTGRGYIVKGDKEGEEVHLTHLRLENGQISENQVVETIGAEKGKLLPQEIGIIVTDYLVKHFETIMNYDFTANVEKDFDKIADGDMIWNEVIGSFYTPFHTRIEESLSDKNYSNVSRELGNDPESGLPLVAKFGQYGPYIQKGEGENRQFAHLGPDQLIESITLEEALKLFELPRTVGKYNDVDVIALKGRFGPYLKYGETNVSLPKGTDPITITLEECKTIIDENAKKRSSVETLLDFEASDIKVINGIYGPYIKHNGGNYKLPKGTDVSTLTEEKCKEIVNNSTPTGRKGKRRTYKK